MCYGLPEIYCKGLKTLPNGAISDCNAQQWEGIRRYGYYKRSAAADYSGSTTQYTSCDVQGHNCHQGQSSATDNTQLAGWTHLHNSEAAYTPVYSYLAWSNDFMWGW